MVTSLKEQPLKVRPVYRNIHVAQLTSYRLPPAGWVSILHRISGALMFLLLPFVIWLFDASLTSEVSYERFTQRCSSPAPGACRAGSVKLVALALIWAYLHPLHRRRCATCGWTRPMRSAWSSAATRRSSRSASARC